MGLVEPAADYSILTLAYWDGWSTPSGVHCEAHFLIGALAPEVKGFNYLSGSNRLRKKSKKQIPRGLKPAPNEQLRTGALSRKGY